MTREHADAGTGTGGRIVALLRYLAFGCSVVFGLFGGLFLIGETWMDPGGVAGVALSAGAVVAMVALAGYALWRPGPAARLCAMLAIAVALFVLLDPLLGWSRYEEIGPVDAVAVFAMAVPLGFLGLHRPLPAGWLLLLVATADLAGVMAKVWDAGSGSDGSDGSRGVAVTGGSSGTVAFVALTIGLIYLLAAAVEALRNRPRRPAGQR